jgi:hypothetical protein
MKLNTLRSLGFDDSYHIPFTKRFKVICSQCNATVINNFPCHENGCPHIVYECKGCDAIINHQGFCSNCLI